MKLKSLGYRSDLIFPKFEGEVTDCGSYLRIRTPQNPTYWWGNFLLFEQPPQLGDFERWTKLFREEIGTPPQTEHMVFAWDLSEEEAVIEPFLEAGFTFDKNVIMTATELHKPAKFNDQVEMRTLETEAGFTELLELKSLVDRLHDGFEGEDYRVFLARKLERYRKMIAAGLGAWFGAYLDGKLVSYMGLFHDGEIARYQNVGTHPAYRRRGIAGTLTHFAGEYGLEHFGVEHLVIIAEDDYFAKDIYASVGFETTEVVEQLERPPKNV